MNLKNKITLNICILVTLSLIIMCSSIYAMSASILGEESNNLTEVQILRAQEKLDLLVEKTSLEAVAFSRDPKVADFFDGSESVELLNHHLTETMTELNMRSDSQYYKDLFCVDLDGIIIASTMPKAMYVDLSSRAYVQDSLKKLTTETSDILHALSDSTNIVNTTHPIFDKDGQLLGLFGIAIKAENFVDFIKDYAIGDEGYFSIVDSNGFILSHREPQLIGKAAVDVLPDFESIFDSDLSNIYKHSTAHYVYSYKKMDRNDWILSTVMPKRELAAKSIGLLKYVLIYGLIIGCFAIFASIRYSNKISSPIVNITDYINHASSSNELLTSAIDATIEDARKSLLFGEEEQEIPDANTFIAKLNERLQNNATAFDREAFSLIKKARSLTAALEMKSYLTVRFLSTLSHDIRTSLTLIKGYAKGLITGMVEDEETRERFIQEIYNSACTLEQISYDVLDSTYEAQYSSGLKKELVDAGEFCTSLYQTAAAYIENSDRLLSGRLEEVRGKLCISQVKILRVWQNMLSNAVKYSEPFTTVTIHIGAVDGKLMFKVADQGIGIKDSDQAYIFDMFFKGDLSQKQSYGLGLFVSRLILEAHGSQMNFSSVPGRGSAFWFSLDMMAEK